MIAVGDSNGSVGVYKSKNGEPVFREFENCLRAAFEPCARFRSLPMETFSPVWLDGLIRLWDLTEGTRLSAWKGSQADR